MSLKSFVGFSAVIGALSIFAAACSAAPGTETGAESSTEAIRICAPPPVLFCPPFRGIGEPTPCPGICPVGEEWSLTLCHCAPIPVPPPDAGATDAAVDPCHGVLCPLEGAASSLDPSVVRCCGPILPVEG